MKEVPQGVGRLPGELGSVTALHWVSLMKARKEHITQCFFCEPARLQWLKSIKTVGKGPGGGREKSPLQHSLCFPLSPSPLKLNSEDHHDKRLCFQCWEEAGGDLEEASAFLRLPASALPPARRKWKAYLESESCLEKLHRTSASFCISGKGRILHSENAKRWEGKEKQESDSARGHVQARMSTTADGTPGAAGRTASERLRSAQSAS